MGGFFLCFLNISFLDYACAEYLFQLVTCLFSFFKVPFDECSDPLGMDPLACALCLQGAHSSLAVAAYHGFSWQGPVGFWAPGQPAGLEAASIRNLGREFQMEAAECEDA